VINNPLEGKTVTLTEKDAAIPTTESLQDCALRVKPVWLNGIAPRVARGETVLVVAHANSIRSMIKCIDAATLDEDSIRGVHIPSATPLVYTFTTIDPTKFHLAGAQPVKEKGRTIVAVGAPSRLGMTGRYVATREIVQLNLGVVPADEDKQAAAAGGSSMFDLIDKSLPQLLAYADEDRVTSRGRAVVVTDGRGVILHVNAPWQELTGFSAAESVGRTCRFLQGPLTSSDAADALNEKLRTGLPAKTTLLNVGSCATNRFSRTILTCLRILYCSY
jgi:PAS domain-containing protein